MNKSLIIALLFGVASVDAIKVNQSSIKLHQAPTLSQLLEGPGGEAEPVNGSQNGEKKGKGAQKGKKGQLRKGGSKGKGSRNETEGAEPVNGTQEGRPPRNETEGAEPVNGTQEGRGPRNESE